jgi:hypothetical protein
MVSDLAQHLAERTIDDKTDSERARTAPINEEIATLKQAIEVGVNANLSMLSSNYDRLISASAILIERFPPAQREALIAKLTHGIAAAPGVYASQEEISNAIAAHVDLTSGFGLDAPGMGILSRDIAQIVTAAPDIAKAGVAVAIYDAVVPIMKPGPNDTIILSKAIERASHESASTLETSHANKVAQTPSAGTPVKA